MNANFQSIRILFRAPDSCQLFGIPYEMRRDVGQAPRHLWEASKRRYEKLASSSYHSGPLGPCIPPDPMKDWIVIDEFEPDTKAWLSALDDVPMGPFEWCECQFASDETLNTNHRHDKLAHIEHRPGDMVRVLYGYRGNGWYAPDGTEGVYFVKSRMTSSNDYKLIRMWRLDAVPLATQSGPDGVEYRRNIAETYEWDLVANASRLVRHFPRPEVK